MAILGVLFGVIALLLSAVGLYGVTSHAVTRRRPEIGIRLAPGAQPRVVLNELLRTIALLVLGGIALGLLTTMWLSSYVAPLLYGIEPNDPTTLVAAVVVLVLTAVTAAWLPAWRAVHVDPTRILREH